MGVTSIFDEVIHTVQHSGLIPVANSSFWILRATHSISEFPTSLYMNLAQILPLILYLVSLLPTSCTHGHCLLEQPALWFLAVYKQHVTSRYLARFLQIPLTS